MPIPEHDAWIHLAPTRPIWFFAVTGTSGFTCCTFHDEPRIRASEAYPSRMVRQTYPSAPLALRRRFRPSRPSPRLLRLLLTFSLRLAPSPFQARGEISPGKNAILPCTTAGSTPPDPWPQELRGFWPARPDRQRLISDFLFIGSQFRSTLPPHGRSPFRSCASLRSLWPAHGWTFTHKSAPMLGAPKKCP